MNYLVKKLQLAAMLLALCAFSATITSCGGKSEPAAASTNEPAPAAPITESQSEPEIIDESEPESRPAEKRINVKADELKRMSIFLSNFVEVGLLDFDVKTITPEELIHFGVRHNYINNFKSRIIPCKNKHCEYGTLTIDKKYVTESIKKYFDKNFNDHGSSSDFTPVHYDGRLYHLFGSDGGDVFAKAEVMAVFDDGLGHLRMIGDLINVNHDGSEEKTGTFSAYAKPYRFNGKDTWSIISFREDYD